MISVFRTPDFLDAHAQLPTCLSPIFSFRKLNETSRFSCLSKVLERASKALKIAARTSFFVSDNTRKHRSSAVFSHIPLEITAQVCSATTEQWKSLLGRAWKPFSARNHCSSRLRSIRQHCRLTFGIHFEIAPICAL